MIIKSVYIEMLYEKTKLLTVKHHLLHANNGCVKRGLPQL